jgi:hypothetical protein
MPDGVKLKAWGRDFDSAALAARMETDMHSPENRTLRAQTIQPVRCGQDKRAKIQKVFRTVLLGSALAIMPLTAPNAFALDAMGFFKGLQAEAEKDGNTLTFGLLESMGDDGARARDIKLVDGKTGDELTIADLELSGTSQVGADGFSFDLMQASDLQLTTDRDPGSSGTISIGKINATGFHLPSSDLRVKEFWPINMETGRLETIRVVSSGAQNVSLNIPSIEISGLVGETEYRMDLGSFLSAPATGSFATENGANGTFSLGAISLGDLKRLGQSGFVLGTLDFGAFNLSGSDEKGRAVSLDFAGANGSNLYAPDFSGEKALFPDGKMDMAIKGASFSLDGTELFRLDGSVSSAEYNQESSDYSANVGIDGLFLNIKEMPAEPGTESGRQQFAALGYDSLSLDLDIAMDWNVASGLLDISKYRFAAKDMAALDLTFIINGYDQSFAKTMQSVSQKMGETSDPEMQQALGFQLLGMMSSLNVVEIALSFDDDSLTNRLLDFQAKQSGQTAEDMAAALPFMAGAMLSQFEIPEFAASVASALTSFLKTSGSITLSAKPERPISVAELMGISAGLNAGTVKPAELIEQFNITVTGK